MGHEPCGGGCQEGCPGCIGVPRWRKRTLGSSSASSWKSSGCQHLQRHGPDAGPTNTTMIGRPQFSGGCLSGGNENLAKAATNYLRTTHSLIISDTPAASSNDTDLCKSLQYRTSTPSLNRAYSTNNRYSRRHQQTTMSSRGAASTTVPIMGLASRSW